jgi:hypothetical protein
MLILSRYIAKHELKPLQKHFDIEDLIIGAKKIVQGLGQQITLPKQKSTIRFFKIRIGGKTKGRMVAFLISENNKVVPILIRLKKDKKFGMNMSAQNPNVVEQIKKNLEHVFTDIEKKNYEEFETKDPRHKYLSKKYLN